MELNDQIHDTADLYPVEELICPFIRRLGGPQIRF